MLDDIIQSIEEELRRKHKFISDELKEMAEALLPHEKENIMRSYHIAKTFELKYWAYDELVDEIELSRKKKYELLVLVENAFITMANIDDKNLKALITKLTQEYMSLPMYEMRALELAQKGKIEEAIMSILEGKSLNAKFYVSVFNHILNTNIFDQYVYYRSLFLLMDDLKDFKEDLKNRDISVSTLLYHYGQHLNEKEIKNIINRVWRRKFSYITIEFLQKKALNLEKELTREVEKFLQLRKEYLTIQQRES